MAQFECKRKFAVDCIFILLLPESNQRAIASSLKSCRPSVYYIMIGESCSAPFPTVQQVNLPACSPHCSFNAERQARKLGTSILRSLVSHDSESNPSLQLQRRTIVPLGHRLTLGVWKVFNLPFFFVEVRMTAI